MFRRSSLVAVLVAVTGLGAAAPAGAFVARGPAWPSPTINYYVAGEYRGAVARPARAWNRAGVGVRLRRTSRANAALLIGKWDSRCGGAALVGYVGPRHRSQMLIGTGCGDLRLVSIVATHEFGHVIGLDHENSKCALMNPTFDQTGTPTHCGRHPISFWYAKPLRADDLRGARALYG
ncbi:MAG: Matrixin [Thermoleophilaceae bacterium]|nr:Matrixin [Thermoleophilaceae bacterium]